MLETDIVSGLPTPDRITPEGVYDVLYKESPSILVGENDPETGEPIYKQEVRYWMQFTWSGVGFHDADWQPALGAVCIRVPVLMDVSICRLIRQGSC